MLEGFFIAGAARKMAQANREETMGEMASRAAGEVRTLHETTQFDLRKLFMVTEALWEILKEEHGYTDEQLLDKIQKIDLRDGKLDGKGLKAKKPQICTECGRTIFRNQPTCLYCGAIAPTRLF